MRQDFETNILQKTETELERISKDYAFYSAEERLLAVQELERRNGISDVMQVKKQTLVDSLEETEEKKRYAPKVTLKNLVLSKGNYVTPIIIYFNIFVFLLMLLSGASSFSPEINDFMALGGNVGVLSLNGQYWRLFTSTFLHLGLLHLLFNMYALLVVGASLEKHLGAKLFFYIYLVTGIFGSIVSATFNVNILSVGASGAIFGVYGVILIMLLTKDFKVETVTKGNFLLSVVLFILYNIFYGLTTSGIDNAAHIGGLASGLIIGLFCHLTIRGQIKRKLVMLLLAVLFIVIPIIVSKLLLIPSIEDML